MKVAGAVVATVATAAGAATVAATISAAEAHNIPAAVRIPLILPELGASVIRDATSGRFVSMG
jgi:hypothetical protein